ncbi:MAG TPA: hypothetical protein ENK20_11585 [Chromatiales bacterium]|nr:hypothetical protein [Chromatiales bacterium]
MEGWPAGGGAWGGADVALLGLGVVAAGALLHPRLRRRPAWRATVTPLASIIGSGFLVIAPLLAAIAGPWAAAAMLVLVLFADAVGAVVRFNIRHVEPLVEARRAPPALLRVEDMGDVALGLAYVVSVAFYVRLLGSFALAPLDPAPAWAERALTTAVLAAIGATGLLRGLRGLEWLELWAVSLKLAVIAALLAGLAWHDARAAMALPPAPAEDPVHLARTLAGALLVTQGFETSRYLGGAYDAATRVRAMRRAQLLAGAIYVVFVALAAPLTAGLDTTDETAVIAVAARVAPVLPAMLVLAALMSQLSAAVADTLGAGGLLHEALRRRVPERAVYGAVTAAAVALVWTADVFAIIALASRAFALYYALQCISALLAARARGMGAAVQAAFAAMAVLLALVVVFALPAH